MTQTTSPVPDLGVTVTFLSPETGQPFTGRVIKSYGFAVAVASTDGATVTVLEAGVPYTIETPQTPVLLGWSKTGKSHAVRPTRPWYSGMIEDAVCGARADVTEATVDTGERLRWEITCRACVRKLHRQPNVAQASAVLAAAGFPKTAAGTFRNGFAVRVRDIATPDDELWKTTQEVYVLAQYSAQDPRRAEKLDRYAAVLEAAGYRVQRNRTPKTGTLTSLTLLRWED